MNVGPNPAMAMNEYAVCSHVARNWRALLARPWVKGVALVAIAVAMLAIASLVTAQIEGDRGVAPINSAGDFEVSDIKVETRGKNAEEARENGWRDAQRLGWAKLWRQSNKSGAAPRLSDSALDGIVSAIVVEKEEIGPRRYKATLGVLFDRARAGQILGIAGARMRSAPLLVIPIEYRGGAATVFEVRTEWQKAWARYRTADSAIDYVRPSGSGIDSVLLNAGQTGRRNRIWWRLILDQFGAADVIVPIARLDQQWPGGPIRGTFSARYGPDNRYIDSFTMTANSGDELTDMLDEAVQRMDLVYSQALARGQLAPDPSLIIEEPVEEEDIEDLPAEESEIEITTGTVLDPATSGLTNISVQVSTPDAPAVNAVEAALRAVPGVRSASVSSLALGGLSVVTVQFQGPIEALRGALQARGWQVQQGPNTLRISRSRPSQPAQSNQPSPPQQLAQPPQQDNGAP